jgi:hypothetical protein
MLQVASPPGKHAVCPTLQLSLQVSGPLAPEDPLGFSPGAELADPAPPPWPASGSARPFSSPGTRSSTLQWMPLSTSSAPTNRGD